jgi:hypothetical protein
VAMRGRNLLFAILSTALTLSYPPDAQLSGATAIRFRSIRTEFSERTLVPAPTEWPRKPKWIRWCETSSITMVSQTTSW